ncbi:M56 family metallopeptidase [Parabacteroides gordonii]|uniref:M56 family metallopeptidase n=1 Tax=Parabacteroides gordonii TaxID=574930 RepID=UPI0026EC11ED|nr:M56 family metallopeptidase [Parabacteroides gordonii]
MGDFFVYILKSSVCLATFYLFYRLLLSRETFHRFNRIALLSVIILSVAIPFIRIMTEEPVALQRPMQNLEYLLQMAQMQTEVEVQTGDSFWLPLLFVVYLVGCLFFFGRFLYSTLWIYRTIRQGEKQLLPDGKKLVVTAENISPFSWMGHIVISRKDMEEGGEEILTHEMAHIRARHSIDMLVCSICVVLQWFNPAVWLLKQELQNIHEYEADENVISNGVEAKKYQLLLIKKAVGSQRFTSMANSFNHSKLKKRITMMLKQKSSPWARLKYLYVLPLTAVAVVAFARPEISRELEKISSAKISEIVPVKEVIEPKKVEPAVEKVAVVIPKVSKVADSVREVKEPVEKVSLGDLQDAMQKQLDDFSHSSEERMRKGKQRVETSQYLILIDNETATYDELDRISPENIESFGVIKKENSLEVLKKHNAENKKGIISVVTKEGIASGKVKKDEVRVVGFGSMSDPGNPLNIKVMKRDSVSVSVKEEPLVFIDGIKAADDAMSRIDPNTIESISVLKDASATKLYGAKAKNGLILITTKNASSKKIK